MQVKNELSAVVCIMLDMEITFLGNTVDVSQIQFCYHVYSDLQRADVLI